MKMCSTGLNACNLGYGGLHTQICHRGHGPAGGTPEKLYKWYGDRVERGEAWKPTEPAIGEMIFPGPPFPSNVPPNGGKSIFSSIATKNANSVSLGK